MQITELLPNSSDFVAPPGRPAARPPADPRPRLLIADRQRIARDLHDEIIQRLFAHGLRLSAEASRTRDPETRVQLCELTEAMDETIRAVRRSIFHLTAARGDSGFRARMTTTMIDVETALGFVPRLRLDGLLDSIVSDDVAQHATAVLREALTNIARHAHASAADIEVATSDRWLRIVVTDNGRGLVAGPRRSGVANMRSRADLLGGTCALTSPAIGGTRLEWRVPCFTQS